MIIPNIKSAKKRVKVIATKTPQNEAINSALKTEIRRTSPALEAQARDRAGAIRTTIRKIDRVATKGTLHKETATRRKSALARKLNTTSAS